MASTEVEEPCGTFKVPHTVEQKEPVTNTDCVSHAVDSNDGKIASKCSNINNEKQSSTIDSKQSDLKTSKSHIDVPLPYKQPTWSGTPPCLYSFEIIKNGAFVDTYNIKTPFIIFGRLDVCDIVFEHPSVSRYHAVVQYCQGDSSHAQGFYLYDLGSTHGTFLNKEKITPKVYYKLKVGYIFKLGGSTRLHIFQGPEEEATDEKPKSPKPEEAICTWGMQEDAEEEEDLAENPFALSTPNEDLYLEDPKKTLRGWFEREGYELEYNVEEKGFQTFVCRVQLPIDSPTGDFMPVEATVSGKKKEAVIACALEACRTLDRLGLLRQSHQESRQRKKKKWEENDYYDSDEDTFLDRTGTIEKKREMRKKMEKKNEPETFESLQNKLKLITDEINEISGKLSESKTNMQCLKDSDDDALDVYMSNLSDVKDMASDKIERRKLKFRLLEAEKEKSHLEKLLDIVRPTKLPTVKNPPVIGKRLKSKLKLTPVSKEVIVPSLKLNEKGEEIEEEEGNISESVSPNKDIMNSCSSSADMVHDDKNDEENIKSYGLIINFNKKDNAKMSSSKKQIGCSSDDFICSRSTDEPKKQKIGIESKKESSPLKRRKKEKNEEAEQNIDVYAIGNSEYSTWVPPANQSGDGITHLNAKYGY